MTDAKLIKLAVRKHIIEKIREVTILELHDLADKYDVSSFHVAECFDNEAFRIEKFFCFPEIEPYSHDN